MSDSPFLTVAEVATRWRMDRTELRALAIAGKIPGAWIRPGKKRAKVLIPLSAVELYEEEHAAKPKAKRRLPPLRADGSCPDFDDIVAEATGSTNSSPAELLSDRLDSRRV